MLIKSLVLGSEGSFWVIGDQEVVGTCVFYYLFLKLLYCFRLPYMLLLEEYVGLEVELIGSTLGGREVNRRNRRRRRRSRRGCLRAFRFSRLASGIRGRCSLGLLSPAVGSWYRNDWHGLKSLSVVDMVPKRQRKGLGFKPSQPFLPVLRRIKDHCGFGCHFDGS